MRLKALKVLIAVICPFAIFVGWMKWDEHQVASFCEEVRPGLAIDALPALAEKHGIARHWVRKGIFDEREKDWVLFVPVAATFGEVACEVRHSDTTVLSTKMSGQ